MKKFLTLVEIIVVIVILSILLAIVVVSIPHFQEDAEVSAISSNLKNIQLAVEKYKKGNTGQYPSEKVPTIGNPQLIKFEELIPHYLKDKPKTKLSHYWIDNQYRVWASTVDAPKVEKLEERITWYPVVNGKCHLYRNENNLAVEIKEEVPDNYEGFKNVHYLISCEDQYGLRTPPVDETYEKIIP